MLLNRFLPIFIVFFLSSGFLFAQDIGITEIINEPYTEVKQGSLKTIGLRLKVFGTTSETNVKIDYQIDNGPVTAGLAMLSVASLTQGPGLVPCPVRFPATLLDTVEVTLFVTLKGDTNNTNDTVKGAFVVKEKVANDLKVELAEPIAGSNLTVGNFHELTFSLTNVGTTDFATGTSLLVYQMLNGEMFQTPEPTTYTGTTLKPGDAGTYTVEIFLNQRHEGADIEFCQYLYWSDLSDTAIATIEGNSEDNIVCAEFKAVPNSLNELAINPWIKSLRYTHQEVQVVFNPAATKDLAGSMAIINASGQLVAQETFSTRTEQLSVPLSYAQPGVYLVQLSSANGGVSTRRFVVGK